MDKARKKISSMITVIASAIFLFFLLVLSSLKTIAIREDHYPPPLSEMRMRLVEAPLLSPIGMVIIIGALIGLAVFAIKRKQN